MPVLSSLQNPLIKQIRKLHRSQERRKQNLILLEGTHLLVSACQYHYELVAVCCTSDWQGRYPQLWKEASSLAFRAEIVTEEVLEAIATTVHPDGVVATARRRDSQALSIAGVRLGLVLERLQDPGNLGTIIRTAAAADADGLWLSEDSVEFDSPKVLRSSAGEWFGVPMATCSDLEQLVRDFRSSGGMAIATLPQARTLYWEVDLTRPTLILLGNEGAGLSPELTSVAECQVKIPLAAGVESLNVAIAAAVILYEARRQRFANL